MRRDKFSEVSSIVILHNKHSSELTFSELLLALKQLPAVRQQQTHSAGASSAVVADGKKKTFSIVSFVVFVYSVLFVYVVHIVVN